MVHTQDAKLHLDEAMRFLTLEAFRIDLDGNETEALDFTIAEDLERIDRAIGPRGESIFAKIGDDIRSAYVEIKAARAALNG